VVGRGLKARFAMDRMELPGPYKVKNFLFFLNLAAEFFLSRQDKPVSGREELTVLVHDTVFDQSFILVSTENDPDRGIVSRNFSKVLEHAHVHIELANVLVGEGACLELLCCVGSYVVLTRIPCQHSGCRQFKQHIIDILVIDSPKKSSGFCCLANALA